MIKKEDILSLNYYTYGQAFTGSCKGMRYRVVQQKEARDEDGNIIQEKGLLTHLFTFDEAGREALTDWLNEMYDEGDWQPGFTASLLKQLTEGKE